MSIEHLSGLENRRGLRGRLVIRGCAWMFLAARLLGLSLGFVWSSSTYGKTLVGDESNYQKLVQQLQPGDQLTLKPGVYRKNLHIRGLAGQPDAPIVISGAVGPVASIFVARPHSNTINIVDSSHVTVRNLILEGRGLNADAVKSGPRAHWSHHITIENMVIRGYGGAQQIVGISTKCPAWNWVVRNNTIIGAGTGMYFGDSDGSAPFVGGLIEHNLVIDTLGYNLQIKHQTGRQGIPQMPSAPSQTVIRYNTFVKSHNGSTPPLSRPNVLLGHFPPSGPGSEDRYLVYGNFFYQNPTERLFQAEGNVAVYNNLFVNEAGDAIAIQPHNDIPRRIWIFHNTVLARDGGILFTAVPETEVQEVAANAVFAAQPLAGGNQHGNLVGSRADAQRMLRRAGLTPPLDLHPLHPAVGIADVDGYARQFMDAQCDFDGRRRERAVPGAYVGSGGPGDWQATTQSAPPVRTCAR